MEKCERRISRQILTSREMEALCVCCSSLLVVACVACGVLFVRIGAMRARTCVNLSFSFAIMADSAPEPTSKKDGNAVISEGEGFGQIISKYQHEFLEVQSVLFTFMS